MSSPHNGIVVITDARHLRKLEEIVNDKPILHTYLLPNDEITRPLGDNITAVHTAYFWR